MTRRIVQVCNTLAAADGGPARYSVDMNAAFLQSGTQAELWAIHAETDDWLVPFEQGHSLGLSWRSPGRSVRAVLSLARSVRNTECLLVDGYFLWWVPPLVAWARLNRVPVILAPHGVLGIHESKRSRLKKGIFSSTVGKLVDGSLMGLAVMSEREGDEIARARPGIATFKTGCGTTVSKQLASGPIHRPVRLLSLSRVAAKKRIDLMIDAASVLQRRGVDVTLTVAGHGDRSLIAALQRQAAHLGIEDRVGFVGSQVGDSRNKLFSDNDIFLLPSDDENFGISMAEAMVAGLVPIVSSQVDAAEYVRNAIVLNMPSSESIADAVIALMSLADFASMRTRIHEEGAHAFSWETVVERWKAVLPSRHQVRSVR